MPEDIGEVSRRDLLRILAGVGAANVLGLGAWGLLEATIPPPHADQWRKGVCRFCGTGCSVQVGLKAGRVVDVRGDPNGHNQGTLCIKGSMLRDLPYVDGRLTTPKVRANGQLIDVTWDDALDRVARAFRDAVRDHGP